MSLKEIQTDFVGLLGLERSFDIAVTELNDESWSSSVELYSGLIGLGYLQTMSSIYPACRQLLGEERFASTVEHYIKQHPPEHYRLNLIGSRFPLYLSKLSQNSLEFPFICELADYEWTELLLMEDRRKIAPLCFAKMTSVSQWQSQQPVLNPVLELRYYNYSIPEIVSLIVDGADSRILSESPVCPTTVAIFRDPHNESVRFLELKPVPASLLALLKMRTVSYWALLEKLQASFSEPSVEELVANIAVLLTFFHMEGVLLGSELIEEN